MLDDALALLPRDVLRERAPALLAEACAWSVGLSDRPHLVRRQGRVVPSGTSLGVRAEAGQRLSVDEQHRLDLVEARPGSFQDALGALTADGGVWADRLGDEVLAPFVLDTCVRAAERARAEEPEAWAELLDELGDDGEDLAAVVRAAEWDVPLRADAEDLLLAALADVPLVEVEAEGLPLSLVRAAERVTRDSAPSTPAPPDAGDLAGARFLADAALRDSGLALPVPPEDAVVLLDLLLAQGLEPAEVVAVLPDLPVDAATADDVAARLAALEP